MTDENNNVNTPLEMTHSEWREIDAALDAALETLAKDRSEYLSDYLQAEEEGDDDQLREYDDQATHWRNLQARIAEELRHCERCRQRFESLIFGPHNRTLCEDCFEIEDRETT
jgi:hypothetical protein